MRGAGVGGCCWERGQVGALRRDGCHAADLKVGSGSNVGRSGTGVSGGLGRAFGCFVGSFCVYLMCLPIPLRFQPCWYLCFTRCSLSYITTLASNLIHTTVFDRMLRHKRGTGVLRAGDRARRGGGAQPSARTRARYFGIPGTTARERERSIAGTAERNK